MKPTPMTRQELFLDKLGEEQTLTAVTNEEKFLKKIGNPEQAVPTPVTEYEKYLYKIGGGEINVPTPANKNGLKAFLWRACDNEVELPTPVTREEMYWDEYIKKYIEIKTLTGALPLTFTTSETALRSWTLHGAHMRHTIAYPPIMDYPAQIFAGAAGTADTWTIHGNSGGVGERTKNLVDLSGVTNSTHNGVTFTVDKTNGTITANRTATGTANATKTFTMTLPAGTYVFSCGENSQRDITYDSYLRANNTTVARDNPDDEPGSEFTLSTETTLTLYIRIQKSYDAQNLVFKPMVRLANTTPEFIPFGYQIPITVSQDETDKDYEIFVGSVPLGEGESVSDTQPIEVFEGISTISTTLTNKPRLDITVFDYYGIASRVNLGYQVKLKVTHNGSTRTIDIPVPNSMDEGDTVTDIDPIPTEIGENTISLNWDSYPTTTMTIRYKE